MNTTTTQLLSIAEAAKALNLSVSNMYRLARENKLPGTVRIGKRWLFDVNAIVKANLTPTQRKAPLPGMPPSHAPVPAMRAPNPDEVIHNAKLVLQHAVEAVQNAAKVMAAMDDVRRVRGSA